LKSYEIDIVDLLPNSSVLPTFSSIITTKSSGERSVVTFTTGKADTEKSDLPQIDVGTFDILLVDGFNMPVSQFIAAQAREKAVPVVLDGGSWKKDMESLLKFVDIAICSADFRPPGSRAECQSTQILDYLAAGEVARSAITRGEKPILFYDGDTYGEIPVEQVKVVDTLAAGDIFHGAFCYYFAALNDFAAALGHASRVATKSCQFFGTRAWMKWMNDTP
jgi:sugar/nucleoside kinase (ribokinase family)